MISYCIWISLYHVRDLFCKIPDVSTRHSASEDGNNQFLIAETRDSSLPDLLPRPVLLFDILHLFHVPPSRTIAISSVSPRNEKKSMFSSQWSDHLQWAVYLNCWKFRPEYPDTLSHQTQINTYDS